MKTILLIEDYADSARLVMRALEPHGYRVLHAPDGESGLQMAIEEEPDLILLDLGLPDVEGQTLAAFIKSLPELASVPLGLWLRRLHLQAHQPERISIPNRRLLGSRG
jgi:two-component system cell cycle response regulator DivK